MPGHLRPSSFQSLPLVAPAQALSGTEIQPNLSGKMVMDGAHWSETCETSGKLVVNDAGAVSAGSWRIESGRLCKLRPGVVNERYEVWLDGDAVELRHARFAPIMATLKKPVLRR